MNIYQNEEYFVIWKPNGISTTMGEQHNFLEFMVKEKNKSQIITNLYEKYQNIYIDKTNELGLLNRLDNGTGGCLRFAKDYETYQNHKIDQKKNKLQKIYTANVYGKVEDMIIDAPIGHHYSDNTRMTTDKSLTKKMIDCQTEIKLLKYYEELDISTIKISINQGVRHQIRLHLSTKYIYIIGENVYTTKGFRNKLAENSLWQNIYTHVYTQNNRIKNFGGKFCITEKNDIYLDNFLYNRDFLTYHLWSIDILKL